MQHYGGVNILRLNHQKNRLSRVTRESWKLSRAIGAFRVRVAFGMNLNSCNTISLSGSLRSGGYTRKYGDSWRLSNVSFARRYPDLSPVP